MNLPKRLVQLDVDSTFIEQEAIELLAAKAGVLDEVATITEAAMKGELDFAQSLIARVKLLEGLSADSIEQVRNEIRLTDGAAELVDLLHQKGHYVSLVSGGFTNILEPIVDELKIDFYKANTLEVSDGKLTGKVVGLIIDRAAKAEALREFADKCSVDLSNTVAIGDGANDLDMMKVAGISIAFNAKPIVEAAADFSIKEPSLRSVAALINL
jgi:phosphoserine phosphatase